MKLLQSILIVCLLAGNLIAQDYIGLGVCPSDIHFAEGEQARCHQRAIGFDNYHESIIINWEITDEFPDWYRMERRSGTLMPGRLDDWVMLYVYRDKLEDGVHRDSFYVHGTGPNYDWTRKVNLMVTKNVSFSVISIEDSSAKRDSLKVNFNIGIKYQTPYFRTSNFEISPEVYIKKIICQDSSIQFVTKRHRRNKEYTMFIGGMMDELHRRALKITFKYIYTDTGLVLQNNTLKKSMLVVEDGECTSSIFPESFSYTAYPNPFKDKININLHSTYSHDIDIQLFNVLGQSVYKKNLNANEGYNMFNLKLNNNLPSGTYFLKVNTEQKSYSKKLLKLK